jgi:hypothetical protein
MAQIAQEFGENGQTGGRKRDGHEAGLSEQLSNKAHEYALSLTLGRHPCAGRDPSQFLRPVTRLAILV